jgi:hypothetical protein
VESDDEPSHSVGPDQRNERDTAKAVGKKKRKKKKTKKGQDSVPSGAERGEEDIDTIIRAVNEEYGEFPSSTDVADSVSHHKTVLIIDRRNLNAENELKRIFGSKTVNSVKKRQHHKQVYRASVLVHVKENWPKWENLGMSMEMTESKNNVQYFMFKHSLAYQQVQLSFMQAVASLDHNNIAAVLNLYPYHIDSLLQLSEVCRMTDDYQMGADLIERALYSFECSFHPLFNYTQGMCHLDYRYRENRSLFLVMFRHVHTISNKGCHKTALEFCKFLLSLNPEDDPLCVLLMIDFFAIRAEEYEFLLKLVEEWECTRNLTQLPNIAISVSLALFYLSKKLNDTEMLRSADDKLQQALIMFPMVLQPLLDKCEVIVSAEVSNSSHFQVSTIREPEALNILIQLFVERNHLMWKVPEVLSWLEANARKVALRAKSKELLFEESAQKRRSLYQGAPRNIYRHVVVSEFPSVVALLPKSVTSSPIMAFDPLPPANSIAAYSDKPVRRQVEVAEESFISLFVRSLLPSYDPEVSGCSMCTCSMWRDICTCMCVHI